MTTHRDPDALLAAYLVSGMDVLPDRVVDAVLDEAHRTRQRVVFGPRRTPIMNSTLKLAFAAAAVVVVVVAGLNFLPTRSSGIGSGGASPSPSVSPSPSPSPSTTRLTVAGLPDGTLPTLTAELPAGWELGGSTFNFNAEDINAFVSLVDNTFSDPCAHVQRVPKVGPSVADLATALGEIPGTTATEPIQTTVAGLAATNLDVTLPAALPCALDQFYYWQDAPDGDWWPQRAEERLRVWIVEAGGQRIAVAARMYPNTSEAQKAELQGIVDSIEFELTTPQPSVTPAAP
jgi:hypothetical protein